MLPEFAQLLEEEQTVVKVRIKFVGRCLAGLPKGGNPLDWYMANKHMSDVEKADFQKRIEEGKVSEEELEDIKATNCLIFEPDHEGNLGLYCGNVKAMMREMFVSMGFTQIRAKTDNASAKSAGGKQLMQHMVHVFGPNGGGHIPFLVNGQKVKEPSGSVVRVKHVSDAAGKRSALGQHDYMESGTEMELRVKWFAHGVHSMDHLKRVWALAQDNGLGACRSQSFGRFEIVTWDVLNDPGVPERVKKAREEVAAKKGADKQKKKEDGPVVAAAR